MSGNTDVLMKTKIFLVKICIWILFSIITGISCAAWYVTGGNIIGATLCSFIQKKL